eukprot:7362197-Prorocentrum_lima.AAC.1
MAYFSDMFPRHLVRLLRTGTDYTLDQAYFDACRHPMTGELIPYFHGVFFSGPARFDISRILRKRDEDLEKIELWERAHGRSVTRPINPPADREAFQERPKPLSP